MRTLKYLPVIAVATLLGACAHPVPHDLANAEVRALPQNGSDFQKALHYDYGVLAQSELDQGDRGMTTVYNTMARMASAGTTVLPTRMEDRKIPAANVAELTEARAKLMGVLDAGGPTRATASTSRAQTQFDCWMEQREENFQPNDIEHCRDGFLMAIKEASGIVYAAATPMTSPAIAARPATPAKPEIETYTVYFDHNRSDLNNAAVAMKNDIVAHIRAMKATKVTVSVCVIKIFGPVEHLS